MTPDQFRKVALSFADVEERAHMAHPDFRVAGKIFATLGYPDEDWGMVALTPEQQEVYLRSHPEAFVRVTGVWGERGATLVRLEAADLETVGSAMTSAWKNREERGRRQPDKPRRRGTR